MNLCRVFVRTFKKPATSAGGLGSMKKKVGKLGAVVEKRILPVETDTHRLVNFVCGSNYMKTGEDIKLKPDAEYPEWLWTLNTGGPKKLDELDPETKQYWRRLRKSALLQNNLLAKTKKF